MEENFCKSYSDKEFVCIIYKNTYKSKRKSNPNRNRQSIQVKISPKEMYK